MTLRLTIYRRPERNNLAVRALTTLSLTKSIISGLQRHDSPTYSTASTTVVVFQYSLCKLCLHEGNAATSWFADVTTAAAEASDNSSVLSLAFRAGVCSSKMQFSSLLVDSVFNVAIFLPDIIPFIFHESHRRAASILQPHCSVRNRWIPVVEDSAGRQPASFNCTSPLYITAIKFISLVNITKLHWVYNNYSVNR